MTQLLLVVAGASTGSILSIVAQILQDGLDARKERAADTAQSACHDETLTSADTRRRWLSQRVGGGQWHGMC